MNDLITWLRGQLDDDERVALAAGLHRWELGSTEGVIVAPSNGKRVAQHCREYDAEHIARWDPARVLAEVDAKRRILDEYEKALDRRKQRPEDMASAGALLTMLLVIKVSALPYADHEGYDETWRPS